MPLSERQSEINAALAADGHAPLWNPDGSPHYESPLEELIDKVNSTGKGSVTIGDITVTLDYTGGDRDSTGTGSGPSPS